MEFVVLFLLIYDSVMVCGQASQEPGSGGSWFEHPHFPGVNNTAHPGANSTENAALIKRHLSDLLHYRGLEDPPHPDFVSRPMPDYLGLVFDALDLLDQNLSQEASLIQHSGHGHGGTWLIGGERTVWGIQLWKGRRLQSSIIHTFMVQAEVVRVDISRVEIVLEDPPSRIQVQICSDDRTHCTLHHWVAADVLSHIAATHYVFDVTPFFKSWLQDAVSYDISTSFPVLFDVTGSQPISGTGTVKPSRDSPVLVIYGNMPDYDDLQPLIRSVRVATNAGNTRRRRRRDLRQYGVAHQYQMGGGLSENGQTLPNTAGPCGLVQWYINFRSIGWDRWVQTPRGYYGNLCVGQCQAGIFGRNDTNVTNHAIIKALVLNEIAGAPSYRFNSPFKISCIPLSFSPISIVFRSGNNTFINRTLGNMTVNNCGCV